MIIFWLLIYISNNENNCGGTVLKIAEKLENSHITMLIIILQELCVYHLLYMCLFDFMEY